MSTPDPAEPRALRQQADQMHDLAVGYGLIAAALEEMPELPVLYRPLAMHVALELRTRADVAIARAEAIVEQALKADAPLEGWSDAQRT